MDTRTSSMTDSNLHNQKSTTAASSAYYEGAAAAGDTKSTEGPQGKQKPSNNQMDDFSNHLLKGDAEKSANNTTATTSSSETTVKGQIDGQLEKLNSDGDEAVFHARAEVKAKVGIGLKGQYGYQVRVAQKGGELPEGMTGQATPPEYEVTFDKKLLAGINGEVPVPFIDPDKELNLRSVDSVSMTFGTKEEAATAVEQLGRLATGETLRDTGSMTSVPTPYPGDTATLPQNPLEAENDITSSMKFWEGPPTVLDFAADAVEPSADEMAFLTDHISGYTTRLDGQARNKLSGKLPLGVLNLEAEIRDDTVAGITRTVELPRNGEPGRVTYTLDLNDKLSSKDGLNFGPSFSDPFTAGAGVHARLEHMTFDRSVSLTWEYPGNEMGPTISGQPYPEIDSAANGGFRAPDNITVRLDGSLQNQALLDPTRTDFVNGSIELSVDQPGQTTSEAVKAVLNGQFGEAAEIIGDNGTLTMATQNTARSGYDLQPGARLEVADLFEVKASLIVEIGVDDVTHRKEVVLGGQSDLQDEQAPALVDADSPGKDENQVTVVPRDGLNLREAPGGEQKSVFSHGTFLTPTGNSQTDQDGRTWMEVTGQDVNGKPSTGWVDASRVAQHPTGTMNDEGRFNPDLDKQGLRAIRVESGDNLHDIANAHGHNFQEIVALNKDHLIDPAQIFEGDVVYLPEQVKPTIAPPETVAQPTSEPVGSLDSNAGIESAETPANVSQPVAEPVPQATIDPERRSTDEIIKEYQVADDQMTKWRPKAGPYTFMDLPFQKEYDMTETEAQMLDDLGVRKGLYGLYQFKDTRDDAYDTADQYFPQKIDGQLHTVKGGEDGHNDAFRHAYWNALMTKRLGNEFATAFGTAHEAKPGNQADREAMDLYNNELGRRISAANPHASDEQLGQLIFAAIQKGEAVVIDANGELVYSDQVAYGATGNADDLPIDGTAPVPEWVNSN